MRTRRAGSQTPEEGKAGPQSQLKEAWGDLARLRHHLHLPDVVGVADALEYLGDTGRGHQVPLLHLPRTPSSPLLGDTCWSNTSWE